MRPPLPILLLALLWLSAGTTCAREDPAARDVDPGDAPHRVNGFDLAGAAVPPGTILVGTSRDGIRALDDPRHLPAAESDLRPGARVLGLVVDGQARAYPLDVLTRHEIVNDRVAGRPVAVTYCPLCASGVAVVAEHRGRPLVFGVSGLLHNSDLLMFDRGTESLWSQMTAEAVTGPMTGTRLERLPVVETTWSDWSSRHPESAVLARPAATGLAYDEPLYPGYEEQGRPWYPVEHRDESRPAMERVLGLALDGPARAWPLDALRREAEARGVERLTLTDRVGERRVVVRYDRVHRSAEVTGVDGRRLPAVSAYWFAWHAFHPEGSVWASGAGGAGGVDGEGGGGGG